VCTSSESAEIKNRPVDWTADGSGGSRIRVEWEADNSMNVPSLSTKTWLVIIALQSNSNQSGFSRQRRNVHTIICLSLHACLYPHHYHQQSILYVDGFGRFLKRLKIYSKRFKVSKNIYFFKSNSENTSLTSRRPAWYLLGYPFDRPIYTVH